MRSLLLVLLGAAIAFPIGVLVHDANAQRRQVDLQGERNFDGGYVHFEKADAALHDALAEIAASQRVQEAVWRDKRVGDARDALVRTSQQLDTLVEEIAQSNVTGWHKLMISRAAH